MESVGFRSGSKIEIFDFAGHTIIADFSPARKSTAPSGADGCLFFGGSSPIFSGGVWLIYRGIEGGSRRDDLNLYETVAASPALYLVC